MFLLETPHLICGMYGKEDSWCPCNATPSNSATYLQSIHTHINKHTIEGFGITAIACGKVVVSSHGKRDGLQFPYPCPLLFAQIKFR